MRTKLLAISVVIIAVAAGSLIFIRLSYKKPNTGVTMEITSPAFANDQPIPSEYTCQGENVNPQINISGVPKNAKSLAIIVDDPDAPGGTYDHWVVWNISPTITSIPRNWTPPEGVIMGANGSDEAKYTGPCPPSGTHHYHFKVFALSSEIDLKQGSGASALVTAMNGDVIGHGELIGTFSQ